MRRLALLIAALLVAPAVEARARHAAPRLPVVVELFTAQGCSDCPKANELLAKLGEDKGVIALSFSVDYWDYLGWKDKYAKPEFSERQQVYKTAFRLRDVYTPQIVLDGSTQLAGAKPEMVQASIAAARKERPFEPAIELRGGRRVQIGSGPAPKGGAVVWLVRYEPGVHEVKITAGENRGQSIKQANEVRELVRLGLWKGGSKQFVLPEASEPDLGGVILVQARQGGRIVAAHKLPAPAHVGS